MPKKNTNQKRSNSAPAKVVKTAARNTPLPKPKVAPRREITNEMIAKRAYEIFAGGTGGDEMHNWLRAERELKAGL